MAGTHSKTSSDEAYDPQPTTTIRAISTTSPKTPPEASTESTATIAASTLPHLTSSSEVHLISTSAKSITHRVAVAIGHVRFSNDEPLRLIRQNAIKKGDVLAVARIAAIQAVKKTSDFIPLAHGGLPVEGCVVAVEPVNHLKPSTRRKDVTSVREKDRIEEALQLFSPLKKHGGVRISVQVETTAKTGVEMEALTGVMGAALTIVDMCKGVDKECVIGGVRVAGKKGGRSGGWGIWGNPDEDFRRLKLDDESQGQGVAPEETKSDTGLGISGEKSDEELQGQVVASKETKKKSGLSFRRLKLDEESQGQGVASEETKRDIGLGNQRDKPDEESQGQGIASKETKQNVWQVTQTFDEALRMTDWKGLVRQANKRGRRR